MTEKMTTSLETERKYDVPMGASLPEFTGLGLSTTHERFVLDARYHDTASLDLLSNRMTLRRREGGHDAGWHLKTPGTGGRREHHMPLGEGVPREILELVEPVVGEQPIEEVVRLRTERTSVVLLRSGIPVVELADDEVRAEDLREGVQRSWREWEAELLPGAPSHPEERSALLDAVESLLRQAGAVPSTSASKLARALGRSPLPEG